jgi:hypothetical protein
LVRCFLSTGRAGDYIARTNGVDRFTDANFTLTFNYEKHFFVDMMVVKWKRALARWHGGESLAQFLRTNVWRDQAHMRIESLGGGTCGGKGGGTGFQFDVGNIENRFAHVNVLHFVLVVW